MASDGLVIVVVEAGDPAASMAPMADAATKAVPRSSRTPRCCCRRPGTSSMSDRGRRRRRLSLLGRSASVVAALPNEVEVEVEDEDEDEDEDDADVVFVPIVVQGGPDSRGHRGRPRCAVDAAAVTVSTRLLRHRSSPLPPSFMMRPDRILDHQGPPPPPPPSSTRSSRIEEISEMEGAIMATPPMRSSTTGATATHLLGNAGGEEEEEEEEGRHRRRRRRWSAAAAAEEEASASATTLRLARRGVRTSDITSMTQRNERPADDAVAVVVAVVGVHGDREERRCCRVIFVLSLWRERLHLLLYILVLLAISLPYMSTVICEALNIFLLSRCLSPIQSNE